MTRLTDKLMTKAADLSTSENKLSGDQRFQVDSTEEV